jgi:uncharacterized protein (DUF302 family)
MTRVKNAVIAIEGVYIQNLAAGTLKASIAYDQTQHEVEEAIKKAGYTVVYEASEALASKAPAGATGCNE